MRIAAATPDLLRPARSRRPHRVEERQFDLQFGPCLCDDHPVFLLLLHDCVPCENLGSPVNSGRSNPSHLSEILRSFCDKKLFVLAALDELPSQFFSAIQKISEL